jgi:HD-like signal output (HDOD) protein
MIRPASTDRRPPFLPVPNSPEFRRLDVQLPACPRVLTELVALLDDEAATVQAQARCIEADMSLASAVVRTVNGAMFGLLRRVQTVGEAVRYLGTREVAAITYQTALRAAFPPTPALDALWQRAADTGLLMGRAAPALQIDPFQAHTAGLFALAGQAALLAAASRDYEAMLRANPHGGANLLAAEWQRYGVHHAALGSALCAAWGLATDVVKFVRERAKDPTGWAALDAPLRRLLGLGAAVDAWLDPRGSGPNLPGPNLPGPNEPDASHPHVGSDGSDRRAATFDPASPWVIGSGCRAEDLFAAIAPHRRGRSAPE